ncbi:diaminopimelate epimerase [Chloroflexota bacterium]
MKFTKMQGTGNDFVLIESSNNHQDWSKIAITICDRHFGIGADSLLLLLPSDKADFMMRTFDPDGSEAEACGNGIRCVGRYVYEKGMLKREASQIKVETMAGIRTLHLNQENGRVKTIQANMGEPLFHAGEIPVVIKDSSDSVVDIKSMLSYTVNVAGRELTLILVSMGNPHAVYFQQQPVSEFPLCDLGPEVENLKIFPNRVNFEVVRVMNRQQVEARVWERGAGETMACGSGACAIIVAAQKLGYTDDKINVQLPGGKLEVEWHGTNEVLLSGPAEFVFTGEWPE